MLRLKQSTEEYNLSIDIIKELGEFNQIGLRKIYNYMEDLSSSNNYSSDYLQPLATHAKEMQQKEGIINDIEYIKKKKQELDKQKKGI